MIITVANQQENKICSIIKFPNHPQKSPGSPCSKLILKKVSLKGDKTLLYTRKISCYNSVIKALQSFVAGSSDFQRKCEEWRNRVITEDVMADVTDGRLWKDFQDFFQEVGNYGLMLNFDFFQPFKRGIYSVGVLYLTVMNLPRSERFKRENVILVGVIPQINNGTSINPFLEPLVKELNQLWTEGFQCRSSFTGTLHKFKAALLCVACDLPAARKLCGFLGHCARKGCSKCNKSFGGTFGKRDYSGFERDEWHKRDDKEHKRVCEKLKHCNTQESLSYLESKFGVKLSVLNDLPYFSAVRFCVIDPMHNLYLGTAKRMVQIWISKGLLTDKQFLEVQEKVDNIEVGSDIGRIPRKIASGFGGFTADQWKNWTNLFSITALKGVLPEDHLECWRLFVLASRLLTSRVIRRSEIIEADNLLMNFCTSFQELYGEELVTPNMHLHCHLAECLLDYGPVFSFWCFSFERYNGILGKYHTNHRSIETQIMRKFLRDNQLFDMDLPADYFEEMAPIIRREKLDRGSMFETTVDPKLVLYSMTYASSNLSNLLDWQCDLELYQLRLPRQLKLFTDFEIKHLQQMYKVLYYNAADTNLLEVPKSYSRYKSFVIAGELWGSELIRSERASHVMAPWVGYDGKILTNSSAVPRPGKVEHYILHNPIINGVCKPHLLAKVKWYQGVHVEARQSYGKPVELWCKDLYEIEGPATYIPVQRFRCKFIAASGSYRRETVMLVTPRQRAINI